MAYGHTVQLGTLVGASALTIFAIRRARKMKIVPSELRNAALIVSPTFSSMAVWLIRKATALSPVTKPPRGVRMTELSVASSKNGPAVRVVLFERETTSGIRPALLWMHGGGYVIGTPEQDMAFVARILDTLDIAIVSVDYRLAPEHPFPAALHDCHTALAWLVEHASEMAIDVNRIAIGGQSAGGGLAAALVQRAVDDQLLVPAFQLLVYPMLDARTTRRHDHGVTGQFVWTPKSNRFGWARYLGHDPAIETFPVYAVPAQRDDFARLPPAWIGVGTLDLFHDEDVEYGERLKHAGVASVTYVTEGGYHAFDLLSPESDATFRFYASMLSALSDGLFIKSCRASSHRREQNL